MITLLDKIINKSCKSCNSPLHNHSKDCWLWVGSQDKDGYGVIVIKGRQIPAHKVSYFVFNGIWPERYALHKCNTPRCVNPKHIYDGTWSNNMQDKLTAGNNYQHEKIHCKNGHEFTIKNTYYYGKSKHRHCRRCDANNHIRYRKELKDKVLKVNSTLVIQRSSNKPTRS